MNNLRNEIKKTRGLCLNSVKPLEVRGILKDLLDVKFIDVMALLFASDFLRENSNEIDESYKSNYLDFLIIKLSLNNAVPLENIHKETHIQELSYYKDNAQDFNRSIKDISFFWDDVFLDKSKRSLSKSELEKHNIMQESESNLTDLKTSDNIILTITDSNKTYDLKDGKKIFQRTDILKETKSKILEHFLLVESIRIKEMPSFLLGLKEETKKYNELNDIKNTFKEFSFKELSYTSNELLVQRLVDENSPITLSCLSIYNNKYENIIKNCKDGLEMSKVYNEVQTEIRKELKDIDFNNIVLDNLLSPYMLENIKGLSDEFGIFSLEDKNRLEEILPSLEKQRDNYSNFKNLFPKILEEIKSSMDTSIYRQILSYICIEIQDRNNSYSTLKKYDVLPVIGTMLLNKYFYKSEGVNLLKNNISSAYIELHINNLTDLNEFLDIFINKLKEKNEMPDDMRKFIETFSENIKVNILKEKVSVSEIKEYFNKIKESEDLTKYLLSHTLLSSSLPYILKKDFIADKAQYRVLDILKNEDDCNIQLMSDYSSEFSKLMRYVILTERDIFDIPFIMKNLNNNDNNFDDFLADKLLFDQTDGCPTIGTAHQGYANYMNEILKNINNEEIEKEMISVSNELLIDIIKVAPELVLSINGIMPFKELKNGENLVNGLWDNLSKEDKKPMLDLDINRVLMCHKKIGKNLFLNQQIFSAFTRLVIEEKVKLKQNDEVIILLKEINKSSDEKFENLLRSNVWSDEIGLRVSPETHRQISRQILRNSVALESFHNIKKSEDFKQVQPYIHEVLLLEKLDKESEKKIQVKKMKI